MNELHKRNQGSNFLGGSISKRDNKRAPIQFRRERQPQHDFSRIDPSIFTSIAIFTSVGPVLLDRSSETT